MGFWGALFSTIRNSCRSLYNLGCAMVRKIWPAGVSEALKSTTEKLTKTATNICSSSYELCCAAVRKVHNAIRVVGEQIPKEYLPSQEREKIQQFLLEASKYVADVAIRKFLKGYTYTFWLDFYNIIVRVVKSPRQSDHGKKKSKCSGDERKMEEVLKEKDKMQEQMNNINYHIKILLEQIQKLLLSIKPSEFPNEKVFLESVQKLEDVTSPSMREGFKGGD